MKPNPYKVPDDPQLGSKEYQPVVSIGGPVSSRVTLAAIGLPMGSSAIGTWAAASWFVLKIPASLTLPGHIVCLAFGAIVGALIGLTMITIMRTRSSPLRLYPQIAIIVATLVAPELAVGLLFFMSESVFYLIPHEIMDRFVS